MKEKLQTLPLTQLRELAKAQGVKSVTTLKKAELIEKLCELSGAADAQKKEEASAESKGVSVDRAGAPADRVGAPSENAGVSMERAGVPAENTVPEPVKQEAPQRAAEPRREEGRRQYQPREYQQREYQPRNYQQRNYQQRGDGPRGYQPRSDSRNDNQGGRNDSQGGRNDSQNGRNDGQQGTENRESVRMYQARTETPAATEGRETQVRAYQPRSEAAASVNSETQGTPAAEQQARAEAQNDFQELDSGIEANGILEVMPDGFGFIRCENFLPGENDVYVAPSQIRRFNLKTGDIVKGSRRIKSPTEKFAALLYINTVNGYPTSVVERRPNFENLTPIFPDKRLHLEVPGAKNSTAMRVMDLVSPIGKGQRGMIVSPPKAGKTTLLKQVAKAVTTNHPEMHLIILLIDERPEEVTDIKEAIQGPNVEVIYSTFDELPERHKRVSEMVIERAKRLVEHGRDVMILLDSMTRLARAYNLVVPPSGRTLSGGLDPAALHMPKRFFGAARNMREGGSLTILATALIETGSRMDDVIYEEFKGTGNMELVLDRKLSEKRIFPALDILRSGTRRDDLLLTAEESEALDIIHKATNSQKPEESVERILDLFSKTRNNAEFVDMTRKRRFF